MGAVPIIIDHICDHSTTGSGGCQPAAGAGLADFPLPTPHRVPGEDGEGSAATEVGSSKFASYAFANKNKINFK